MDWVKTNHVKRALREGRPTAGAWLHLCSGISADKRGYQFLSLGSDTAILVNGAHELAGRFAQEVRSP